MTDIIIEMFDGWITLGMLMIIPTIYLFIFRAIPKKILFVISAAIVTAGTVNVIYYSFDPVTYWVMNILPSICENDSNTVICKFFRSYGSYLEEFTLVIPLITVILISHLMAKKLWDKLTNDI